MPQADANAAVRRTGDLIGAIERNDERWRLPVSTAREDAPHTERLPGRPATVQRAWHVRGRRISVPYWANRRRSSAVPTSSGCPRSP